MGFCPGRALSVDGIQNYETSVYVGTGVAVFIAEKIAKTSPVEQ